MHLNQGYYMSVEFYYTHASSIHYTKFNVLAHLLHQWQHHSRHHCNLFHHRQEWPYQQASQTRMCVQ